MKHTSLSTCRLQPCAASRLQVEQRGSYIDSSGFLRLLSWMLDPATAVSVCKCTTWHSLESRAVVNL